MAIPGIPVSGWRLFHLPELLRLALSWDGAQRTSFTFATPWRASLPFSLARRSHRRSSRLGMATLDSGSGLRLPSGPFHLYRHCHKGFQTRPAEVAACVGPPSITSPYELYPFVFFLLRRFCSNRGVHSPNTSTRNGLDNIANLCLSWVVNSRLQPRLPALSLSSALCALGVNSASSLITSNVSPLTSPSLTPLESAFAIGRIRNPFRIRIYRKLPGGVPNASPNEGTK